MTTLQAPDGTRFTTDDPNQVRDLTLGHGYTVIDEDQEPAPATPETQPAAQSDTAPDAGEHDTPDATQA